MSEPHSISIPSEPAVTIDEAWLRSQLYRFLASSFLYPQTQLREEWHMARLAAEALGVETALAELAPPGQEQLQHQFVQTFTHTTPSGFPPYETEYGAGHVFDQVHRLGEIAGFYRSFGVAVSSGERLDHMGVELEFMYFLAFKEAHAREHLSEEQAELCRYAQRRFLEQHLGRWSPLFLRLLAERGHGFYRRLAQATGQFLAREIECLGAKPVALGEESLRSSEDRWQAPEAEASDCGEGSDVNAL